MAKDFKDVAIVGISEDVPERQKRFDDKCALGYPLLCDIGHVVAESFGVWREKMLYGKSYLGVVRSVFVIDAAGLITHAFYKISPKDIGPKLADALAQ